MAIKSAAPENAIPERGKEKHVTIIMMGERRKVKMKVNVDPLRDVQEEAPAAYCEQCKQEIYPNGCMGRWEGQWMCEDCLRDAIEREARENLWQLVLELGLDVEHH